MWLNRLTRELWLITRLNTVFVAASLNMQGLLLQWSIISVRKMPLLRKLIPKVSGRLLVACYMISDICTCLPWGFMKNVWDYRNDFESMSLSFAYDLLGYLLQAWQHIWDKWCSYIFSKEATRLIIQRLASHVSMDVTVFFLENNSLQSNICLFIYDFKGARSIIWITYL